MACNLHSGMTHLYHQALAGLTDVWAHGGASSWGIQQQRGMGVPAAGDPQERYQPYRAGRYAGASPHAGRRRILRQRLAPPLGHAATHTAHVTEAEDF